jgi:hypothetical protein
MGMEGPEAAKKAHYKRPYVSSRNNIQNHTQAFREAFAVHDYTLEDIATDIIDGTKAMRTISAMNTDNEANGKSCDFIDVADWNARHKFIHEAIEVQGFKASEKMELTGKGGEAIKILFEGAKFEQIPQT